MLKKIYSIINAARNIAVCTLLGGMVLLCLVQVVLRYFTSAALRPFPWGDEIIRLTSIWVAFLAAGIGVRESSHLSVDYFVSRLFAPRGRIILKKITLSVVLISMILLVWHGIAQVITNTKSMLQNVPVSIAWFYAAIPVGCAYIFIDYLLILIYGYHPFTNKQNNKNQNADSAVQ
jgi:TRAP-type C4-dicarboxylate transport system permease small subunit